MVAQTYRDKLPEMKENVEASRNYFQKNIERFYEFMKFVFETSIDGNDEAKLAILQKPIIEFNILEAMISRLRGEFSKQEPSLNVRAADGVRVEELTPEFLETIKVLEAHLREIFFDSSNDSLEYNIYSDLLAGGFSVVRIFTDYVNEMSFEQNIKIERVFDPTLCGFDPMARDSHKGDGDYCFEIIPKTRDAFEAEFGKDKVKGMRFIRSENIGGFNWSYETKDQDIILVCDYYYKKRKNEKIVKLSNGHVILKKHYEQFMEIYNSKGYIEQAPIIIAERETTIESINRCLFCETEVLSHEETAYRYFPLVFFDGNSVNLRDDTDGSATQMTRPIVYHAKGIQQLKNFAGQSVAAEIENMVQHKFIVSVEAIPEEYQDAYKNVQQASTLVYNAFYKDDPTMPLTPPREIQRTPTPPIVENTFMGTDQVTQTILGNYDGIMKTNDKQVSGVALQQGALQSNAAALPYLMGYIKGLNRSAIIVADLIPKFYVTPRSLPVRQANGKRSYQVINHQDNPDSVDFYYNPDSLQIKVEAGVSSGIQKQVALEQLTSLSQAIPVVGEFVSEMGLEIVIDNMDIRGSEELKVLAAKFMEMRAQAKQAQAQQPDPLQLEAEVYERTEMAKVEQQAIKVQGDQAIQAAKVANEKQLTDIKFMEAIAKIKEGEAKQLLEQERVDSENARTAVETAINFAKELGNREPTNEV